MLSKLAKFTQDRVKEAQLNTDEIFLLPSNQVGQKTLQRQRISVKVNGPPKAIRNWLKKIHSFDDFRTIARLTLSSKRDDPNRQIYSVEIHQWLVPQEGKVDPKKLSQQWSHVKKKLSKPLSPVDILEEIKRSFPKESDLLLTHVEVIQGLRLPNREKSKLVVKGRSTQAKTIGNFENNLRKAKALERYQWMTQQPARTKGGDWTFLWLGKYLEAPEKR